MKNKVKVDRYNVMEAMENVVKSRGYGTVAAGQMFDSSGEPYCIVGSVAVELNAETKGKFSGSMYEFGQLFEQGYFEWADHTEKTVVYSVLQSAMGWNDSGETFGEVLSRSREKMRELSFQYPASEPIKVIAKRIEAAHFLSQATA